jgi:hypothetical protein
MSKTKAIILILVIFILTFGGLIWYYFSFNPIVPITGQKQDQPTTTLDIYDPFGTKANDANQVYTDTANPVPAGDTSIATLSTDKLRQISAEPISGFSVSENIQTKKTDIHYTLRANGNIYETYTDSPEQKRLSITTIPKVYEALWLPGGQKQIIQYLKEDTETIETFSIKLNPSTTTLNEFSGGIDGKRLEENITALAINPTGDKIFYLIHSTSTATGLTAKPDGLNKKIIFTSPISEWLVSWPKEETITLNTKPSSQVAGYMYFLNSVTGSFSKVLGDINGLTTKTNKTTTQVLYSDSIRGNPKLYLYNIKTKESKLLPWSTLPEKCLWSNTDDKIIYCAVPKAFLRGEYPDSWYQGLVSFSDDIWMMNTDTGAATLVYDIEMETTNKMDLINLQLDKTGSYLFFMNKTDLTFWSLDLNK